jgi:hypothetical protein
MDPLIRPLSPLCWYGHIASYSELLEHADGAASALMPYRQSPPRFSGAGARSGRAGASSRDREPGGYLHEHVRRDVYVCRHIDDDEYTAALVGGALDCVTVLARRGLPVPGGDRPESLTPTPSPLHLRVPAGAGRVTARIRAEPRPIRPHWSSKGPDVPSLALARQAARRRQPLSRLEVELGEALRQALTTCLTAEESIAVIREITPQYLSADATARAIAGAPRRVRAGLRRLGLPDEVQDALDSLAPGRSF